MLSPMPHDELDLSRQLHQNDGICQLGGNCQHNMLSLSIDIVGRSSHGQDQQALSQCLPHIWSDDHERESRRTAASRSGQTLTKAQLGFVVPLAVQPDQCYDTITPHSMSSSKVCGASGSLLLLGGWCGVMWAFLRSLSLHLQICWQVIVGRNFMIFAQAVGWGVPLLGITLALVLSGVSFRFGPTCHINHRNSLADLWIPLLLFAGATVVLTFATFGYCVKVYLVSLYDTSASTENSGLPPYSNSVRTVSPRQAYRRVKRVIALQWRGIAIVLIIIADVIFFSVIFVFQDNVVQSVTDDARVAEKWVTCLIGTAGNKNACLKYTDSIVVNEATVSAVLLLLGVSSFPSSLFFIVAPKCFFA